MIKPIIYNLSIPLEFILSDDNDTLCLSMTPHRAPSFFKPHSLLTRASS